MRSLRAQHRAMCADLRLANAQTGHAPRRLQHLVRRKMLVAMRAAAAEAKSASALSSSAGGVSGRATGGGGLCSSVTTTASSRRAAPLTSSPSVGTNALLDYVFSLASRGRNEGVATATWPLEAIAASGDDDGNADDPFSSAHLRRVLGSGATSYGFAAPHRHRRTLYCQQQQQQSRGVSQSPADLTSASSSSAASAVITARVPCSQFLWRMAEDAAVAARREAWLLADLAEALGPRHRLVSMAESAVAEISLDNAALRDTLAQMEGQFRGHLAAALAEAARSRDAADGGGGTASAARTSSSGRPASSTNLEQGPNSLRRTAAEAAAGLPPATNNGTSRSEAMALDIIATLQHRLRTLKKRDRRLDELAEQLRGDVAGPFAGQTETLEAQLAALKKDCRQLEAIAAGINATAPLATSMLTAGGAWVEAVHGRIRIAATHRRNRATDDAEGARLCRSDAAWYSRLLVGIKKLPFAVEAFNVLLVPRHAFGDGRARALYVPESLAASASATAADGGVGASSPSSPTSSPSAVNRFMNSSAAQSSLANSSPVPTLQPPPPPPKRRGPAVLHDGVSGASGGGGANNPIPATPTAAHSHSSPPASSSSWGVGGTSASATTGGDCSELNAGLTSSAVNAHGATPRDAAGPAGVDAPAATTPTEGAPLVFSSGLGQRGPPPPPPPNKASIAFGGEVVATGVRAAPRRPTPSDMSYGVGGDDGTATTGDSFSSSAAAAGGDSFVGKGRVPSASASSPPPPPAAGGAGAELLPAPFVMEEQTAAQRSPAAARALFTFSPPPLPTPQSSPAGGADPSPAAASRTTHAFSTGAEAEADGPSNGGGSTSDRYAPMRSPHSPLVTMSSPSPTSADCGGGPPSPARLPPAASPLTLVSPRSRRGPTPQQQ